MDIKLKTLEVGDYVVSDRVGIERKTVDDFLSTLLDGRDLFGQISDLRRTFDRALLIIEVKAVHCEADTCKFHPGCTVQHCSRFRVPIIFSRDEEDTAALIAIIAKREQTDGKRDVSLHGRRLRLLLKSSRNTLYLRFPR